MISRLTVNELVKIVHENESIHIPIGSVHRLEDPGKILLELIEVQTGSARTTSSASRMIASDPDWASLGFQFDNSCRLPVR